MPDLELNSRLVLSKVTADRPSLCPAELFCMGFSFAAFFFFVLITRTTNLDYDSQFSWFIHF